MRLINLVNQRFGRLVVLERETNLCSKVKWKCICDCGNNTYVAGNNLKSGRIKSCGCFQSETQAKRITIKNTIHGHNTTNVQSPTWMSWISMKKRCNNSKHRSYPNYGGRGIKICERWNNFANFLEDMGERPIGKTLDRYPNKDGNYEPNNCRWATPNQQQRNRRDNRPGVSE